jgi:hypothetical protein
VQEKDTNSQKDNIYDFFDIQKSPTYVGLFFVHFLGFFKGLLSKF